MGKSKHPTIGYKYFMGLHLGLCHGPIDALLQIRAGGRDAWSGAVTSNQEIYIDNPGLFGGDQKEGGLQGYLDVMLGASTQMPNDYLQAKEGNQQPGYRGLCTVVYRGGEVCSLNPYLKEWQFQVWRSVTGWTTPVWYPETANITLQVEADVYDDQSYYTDTGQVLSASNFVSAFYTAATDDPNNPNSPEFNPNNPSTYGYNYAATQPVHCQNPAHIVYECLTNIDWGLGYPVADIDDTSFRAAALQLYNEGFGMCICWTQQDQIDKFVQSICDHAGACFVVNPQTGLFQFKLIRGGYDPTTLLVLDQSNIKTLDFKRAAPVNMVNEVQVQYVNANTGKTHKTPPAQNNANIANAGGIISQAKEYPGIPCGSLALRVAMRDLATQGTPLSQVKLAVNRGAAATLTPGDVFVLNWAPLNIAGIVYRVGEINYGKLDDGEITITAIEDVFGLPAGSYASIQQSQWLQTSTVPVPSPLRQPMEASYRDVVTAVGTAAIGQLPTNAVYAGLCALKPTPISLNYDLWTNENNNAYASADPGADFCPFGQLDQPMVQELVSTFNLDNWVDVDQVTPGTACQIGTERCIVETVTISGPTCTVVVERGADDSVPHTWPAGTPVWFYDEFEGVDQTQYAVGETWYAKALVNSSTGTLPIAQAPADSLALVGRWQMPMPPANVTVNGQSFPTSITGDMTVAWATRNRLIQQDQLVPFSAASITPEAGATFTIQFADESGKSLGGQSGLTATTFTLTAAQQAASTGGYLGYDEVWSRDFLTANPRKLTTVSSGAGSFSIANNLLTIGTAGGNTVETLVRFDGAPGGMSDVDFEFDIIVPPGGDVSGAGIVYRTSSWPGVVNSWGWAALIYGQELYLFKSGNGTNSLTLVTQAACTYPVDGQTPVRVRARAVGPLHTIFVDDVQLIQVTDTTYQNIVGPPALRAVGAAYQLKRMRVGRPNSRPSAGTNVVLNSQRGGLNSYDTFNYTVPRYGYGLRFGQQWGD